MRCYWQSLLIARRIPVIGKVMTPVQNPSFHVTIGLERAADLPETPHRDFSWKIKLPEERVTGIVENEATWTIHVALFTIPQPHPVGVPQAVALIIPSSVTSRWDNAWSVRFITAGDARQFWSQVLRWTGVYLDFAQSAIPMLQFHRRRTVRTSTKLFEP
jgi:hypothetical protein